MNILIWIIFGALAGWIASMIVGNNGSQGWVGNIIVGIVGAIVGGWISGFFGFAPVTGFNLYSLLVAIVGAVAVLAVFNMLTGRQSTP